MSFPWTTAKQRRKQQEDEEFARRAAGELAIKLNCGREIKGTITEIDGAEANTMADILKRQGQLNVLRPAERPASRVVGKTGVGRSTLAETLIRSLKEN